MSGPLISAYQLLDRLGQVTVLDVRWQLGRSDGMERYLEGHVPSASYVELPTELADPPFTGTGGRHPLPAADRFGATMRRHGVRSDRSVVVYDGVGGTSAARAWWLLRYFGHPDVRLLDGGWHSWSGPVETGETVETVGSGSPAGAFVAAPGGLPVVDAVGAARLAEVGRLYDARAPQRFRGEVEPVDPVAGHVPGAMNVPATANLDDGRFRPVAELAEMYAVPAGVPVGAYCGSGVTAAHDVLALSLLGVEAALYAGSWSDWVTDPSRRVDREG